MIGSTRRGFLVLLLQIACSENGASPHVAPAVAHLGGGGDAVRCVADSDLMWPLQFATLRQVLPPTFIQPVESRTSWPTARSSWKPAATPASAARATTQLHGAWRVALKYRTARIRVPVCIRREDLNARLGWLK
ncbi:MAG: hypothetical protein ACPIOQ_38270 [Promethearchaeia archaeon]